MVALVQFISERFPLPKRRWGGSLRTQLIFWNVLALSLLVGGLGIVCRFVMLSFMMQSVNRELEREVDMFVQPPHLRQGPFNERHNSPPPFPGKDSPPSEPGAYGNDFRSEGPPPAEPHPHENGFGGEVGSPFGPNHREDNHAPHHPPDADNPYHLHHFDAQGHSEIPNDKRPMWDAGSLARALRGETVFSTVMVDGEPLRVLSAPGFTRLGKKGANQIAYPLKEVYRALSGIDTALLVLIPVGLLGAGWMGSALTNRVLRPVHQMTQAAGHIATGNRTESFTCRLPVSGNDEFSELAQTFNGLLGWLNQSFQEQQQMLQRQQRFTANASHELKTPLTIVKGRAGLALSRASTDEKSRHAFQEINAAADTMSQLVQDLLLLARSDEGRMGRDAVELLMGEVLATARTQATLEGSAPIALHVEPEDLCVVGNAAELIRLFRNLIDNAVRYTPPEGFITVTAQTCSEENLDTLHGPPVSQSIKSGSLGSDKQISTAQRNVIPGYHQEYTQQYTIVTVEDTGAGIALEHLPHLGERFYRADASRTRPTGGTGLGLSICRSIVEAHGGLLSITSEVGQGTLVTVILPHIPPAAKREESR